MNKSFGVSISIENYNRLKKEAQRLERSMSWIINKAITFYLREKEEGKRLKIKTLSGKSHRL